MDKESLVKICLQFEDSVETYPFSDKNNADIAVVRHISNEKWFALIFFLEGKLFINLKCNPYDSLVLRDMYSYITPAWHMNKKHWIKVDVNEAPLNILTNLIKCSYKLTLNKSKK